MGRGSGGGASKPPALHQEKEKEIVWEKKLEEAKKDAKDANDRATDASKKAKEDLQNEANEVMRKANEDAEAIVREAEQQANMEREAGKKVRQEAEEDVAQAMKDAEHEVRNKLKTTNEILERYGLLGEMQTDGERTGKGETWRDQERDLQQAIQKGDVVSLSTCLESMSKVNSIGAPSVKDIRLSSHLVRGHNKVLARCFGSEGTGWGQFSVPRQIAIDHETGNMLVVDQKNQRVQVFGQDEKFVCSLFENQIESPSGIGLGQNGKIVAVTDAERHTVQIFSAGGGFRFKIGNKQGPGNNQFDNPGGVAIDSDGQIFVADTNNNRIQVLELWLPKNKASFVGYFSGTLGGSCGRLRAPTDVALDKQEKNILVADAGNGRVQVMDKRDGHWVRTIGAGHLKAPQQVATNSVGHIVVVDAGTQTVQVYKEDGTWLESLGGQGSAVGQLREPYGVAIDSQDNIVVSDASQNRVHIFGVAGDKREGSGEVKDTDLYIPRAGGRLRSFGSGGNKEGGEFQMPRQLAIAKSGHMVVVDQNNKRVQVFDHKTGSFIFSFGKSGTQDGDFQAPSGVSVGSPVDPEDGKIIVTDVKNHNVQVFDVVSDDNGIYRARCRLRFGIQGKENGQFECPSGVAVDHKGQILVADTNNNRIQVFEASEDSSGNYKVSHVETFERATGEKKFKQPRDVAVNGHGHIIVVDAGNERLQVLDADRNLVRNIHSKHLKSPYQVVTDSQGNLVISDHTNNTVQFYDEEGRWMESLGGTGSAVGQLKEPCGVAVDDENNVVVSTQNRIQIFAPSNRNRRLQGDDNDLWQWEGGSLRCFGVGGSAKGEFNSPLQVAIDNWGALLKWEEIDAHNLTDIEILNEALADQCLEGKLEFSQEEWENFGVSHLTHDAYIKAGDRYFKPAKRHRMLVVDQNNYRVQVFDEKGSHIISIGRQGDQNGQFESPCGVAVDQDGNVYVTDISHNNVQVFSRDGRYKNKFPNSSSAARGVLKCPRGVAVHGRKIYVADTNQNQIQVFDGDTLEWDACFSGFKAPRDVAFSQKGSNLLVADSGNRQIQVIDTNGKLVRIIGKGSLKAPHQVATDSRGHIVVVDVGTHTVQIFKEDGTWLESLGGQGSAVGQLRDPNGVAIDSQDNIVVSDTKHNRVQIFGRASDKDAELQIPRTGGPLRSFGSRGAKVGEFQMPRQLAIDRFGHMVVVDQNNQRIQVFDTNGTFIRSFGSKGLKDGQFQAPLGVGVDTRTGRIMVTDVKNHNVQIFDAEGTFLFKLGNYGEGDGELNNPSGVAMDQNGFILVADSNNNRIEVFDGKDGAFIRHMGKSKLKGPRDVAVGQRGEIVIADTGHGRLQVLDKKGNFIRTIHSKNLKTPQQLVIDSANNIVVVDNSIHTVQVYDFEGAWLETLGCQGSAVGQLSGPCGVTVDNEDNVIVSDTLQNRIQIFGIQNYKGTALHVAAASGKEGTCKKLLDHCRELEFFCLKDSRGKTALQVAEQKGHDQIIEELTSWRTQMLKDLQMSDPEGEDELRTEAKKDNARRCEELLKSKINPMSQDDNGDTALHIAAAHGHVIIVYHILHSVCKTSDKFDLMSKKNFTGKTPLDLAYFFNHQRVIQELDRHTTEINDQEKHLVKDLCNRARTALESVEDETERLQLAYKEVELRVSAYKKTENDVLYAEEYRELIQSVLMRDKVAGEGKNDEYAKFNSQRNQLVSGEFSHAAQGFENLLQVDMTQFRQQILGGMEALEQEIINYGDEEVSEIFNYVVYQQASVKKYPNGIRDEGRVGQVFNNFETHENAKTAKLSACEVAALRMYTLPAFNHINNPLRDKERINKKKPHGLALLCYHIREALKKLRSLEAPESARDHMTFWRGMKNLEVTDAYSQDGGTELAPMSTTSDLRIAIQYSMSARSLLFCIRTINSLERGADIEWLSAFPAERETLFPPQTFMQPVKRQVVEVDGMHFTIVEVKSTIA